MQTVNYKNSTYAKRINLAYKDLWYFHTFKILLKVKHYKYIHPTLTIQMLIRIAFCFWNMDRQASGL